MTQTLKPYPEYKDSGTPWLEDIPAHWEALPNRALFAEVNDRNHPEEQLLSVTIAKGVIRQSDLLVDTSKKDSSNEDKANYKLVERRDIAYNKMRAWQGAVGVSDYRGIVSPAYIVVRPRGEQNPDYFHYLLRTPAFAKEAERWSYGITSDQWSLRAEDFKQIYCSLPPEDEQTAIVRFLAHADRRLNRLIRAKRRLIELLNEQKQAIINRAVTRGLDPHVRLKPSGVDWLGDVPEHWDVSPLGRFITLQRGVDITKDRQLEGPIPVVSSGGIFSYHNQSTSKGPGVLVGRKGTVGSVHFVESAYWAHDTTLWVKEFNGNNPKFVYYVLRNLDLQRFDTGSANPTLNRNIVHPERVPFPPVDEQQAIRSFLDHRSEETDAQIRRSSREIDLIREYRTRLIADVVTGKLDVRGVELPALDEDEMIGEWDEGTEEEADDVVETEEIPLADV